ncbi:MAG: hypothetical protein AABY40_04575 [Nanoarchaeota archaeon]
MKRWDVKYCIDFKEKITFKARYVHMREKENRFLCSLEGEFLKDDKPFEPPLKYGMIDRAVTSLDPVYILTPIYYFLKLQVESS